MVHEKARAARINLRLVDDHHVGLSLDESATAVDLVSLINVFASAMSAQPITLLDLSPVDDIAIPGPLTRTSEFLPHPVFNQHHSETEMLRYIHELQAKDLSLVHTMIPLGSCTMKLNSTSSMIPLTWPEFSNIHPFTPSDQVQGYRQIIEVRKCYWMCGSC